MFLNSSGDSTDLTNNQDNLTNMMTIQYILVTILTILITIIITIPIFIMTILTILKILLLTSLTILMTNLSCHFKKHPDHPDIHTQYSCKQSHHTGPNRKNRSNTDPNVCLMSVCLYNSIEITLIKLPRTKFSAISDQLKFSVSIS